jgi:hypothetical protein
MKPKKNICVICKKEIKKKDTYFKVELYNKGKLFGTDYAHKSCRQQQEGLGLQLQSLVSGVKDFAVKNGVIPSEVIAI